MLAVVGPVALGDHFGDRGATVDVAVTNATTQLLQRAGNLSATETPPAVSTAEPAVVTAVEAEAFSDETLNHTLLAYQIHSEINVRREANGLSKLAFDRDLAAIARSHSQDMVQRDFYDHVNPDGADFSDRYQAAGYTCEIETGDTVWTGAENINSVYWNEPSDDYAYVTNESKLAAIIVRQWMNSEGHRKNILQSFWRREGIGVASEPHEEGRKVYITQNFC